MDKNEKLIASVFDNAVTALGLMTNKLSDSIKAPMSDNQLRDHFAGLAMQAEFICPEGYSFSSDKSIEEGCKHAYKVADAMLKARKEVKS